MVRKFLTYCLLFFIPVVLGYLVMEYLSAELPSVFKANKEYIQRESESIETLVLGSSQMKSAVNAGGLERALNLASGDQHHDTDFKLLQSFQKKLPKLKTVVLEVSYSHFELPHNGPDFWKNSLYLKYYDVNCYERATYFKDRLLYLSHPKVYSEKIIRFYTEETPSEVYNEFGFNTNNFEGQFKTLGHDEVKIAAMPRFKINREPNPQTFTMNTALFYRMLDSLYLKDMNVIICKAPMYKTYLPQRQTDILRRRDSVLADVLQKYPNVHLLDQETDTIHYEVNDYWNQSHLNPNGAKKFTARLKQLLETTN